MLLPKSGAAPTRSSLLTTGTETVQLQKLQEMLANSPHAKKIAQFQEMADKSTNPYHVKLRKMQEMLANSQLGKTAELPGVVQKKDNNTGLPDNLKSGIETLSGYSMDDVNVHYT